MAIFNTNGTPYRPSGSLVQFDPENPAHDLFNRLDSEAIRLYGSPLFYYEVFIQTTNIDKLYLEDRSKLWSPIPITIYAYYEPIEPQNPSTAFGIDGPGDVLFECNYRSVLQTIGHVPKRGSRIQSPHLNEFWIVVDTKLAQFQLWGALHLQIVCTRFQETSTDSSSISSPPRPDYTVF